MIATFFLFVARRHKLLIQKRRRTCTVFYDIKYQKHLK